MDFHHGCLLSTAVISAPASELIFRASQIEIIRERALYMSQPIVMDSARKRTAKHSPEGIERIRFTASFTDFEKSKGDTLYEREALKFPPLEDCIKLPPEVSQTLTFENQIERFFSPESNWWNEHNRQPKRQKYSNIKIFKIIDFFK